MGFNHPINILRPLLNQANSEIQNYGRPTKKTLIALAEKLVGYSYRPSQVFPYYSDEERLAAKALLKANGLKHLSNCCAKIRPATLVLIEAEKQILADDEAEQLEVA